MMELAETYAVLGIFAIGTKKEHVDHLGGRPCRDFARTITIRMSPIRITISTIPSRSCFFVPRVAFHAPGQSRAG
jgi:hypothetical protein